MKSVRKKTLIPLGLSAVFLVPGIASAAVATDFQSLVDFIIGLIQLIVPLLIAIALVVFFWGIIKYLFAAGSEERKTSGRETMLWGIIALFLMVAVWGILKLIANTFGIAT